MDPVAPMACPRTCSPLVLRRLGDFGGDTLTSDGFAVGSSAIKVRIDLLYPGSIILFEPIPSVPSVQARATGVDYDGEALLLLTGAAPVSLRRASNCQRGSNHEVRISLRNEWSRLELPNWSGHLKDTRFHV